MFKKFRRKALEVEAWQFDGTNGHEILGEKHNGHVWERMGRLFINNEHGVFVVKPGHWIVKFDEHDWYPISDGKFRARHE